MNLVSKRKIYFIISAIIIIPGLISLFLFGLKPSIDFTGGSRFEFGAKDVDTKKVEEVFKKNKTEIHSINRLENGSYRVRTNPIEQSTKTKIVDELKKNYSDLSEKSFETVGPIIGRETEINALKSVIIASVAIMLYIAFAFRKVSKPVASWKFGVCAIIALLHDVIIVIGAFSLLGHFLSIEVDALFITALLTVMGFSVHDTIVVFDRIRENLSKNYSRPFEDVVNDSLLETINRSLNTSFTVMLVLFTLILFGGESIMWFVAALLIGITAGTYSSIFNASQLLVVWYDFDKKRLKK